MVVIINWPDVAMMAVLLAGQAAISWQDVGMMAVLLAGQAAIYWVVTRTL